MEASLEPQAVLEARADPLAVLEPLHSDVMEATTSRAESYAESYPGAMSRGSPGPGAATSSQKDLLSRSRQVRLCPVLEPRICKEISWSRERTRKCVGNAIRAIATLELQL